MEKNGAISKSVYKHNFLCAANFKNKPVCLCVCVRVCVRRAYARLCVC